MDLPDILRWLTETDEVRLSELWEEADGVRAREVGDEVQLRGLVEISNHCSSNCAYCGIRAGNPTVARYRMEADEVLACARLARQFNYGTLVMQSGEDPKLTRGFITDLVTRIKGETGLAITLSLGLRSKAELEEWKTAGADRYLLRFETSDPALFEAIHPGRCAVLEERLDMLRFIHDLGFETGSGVMVGIPGQSFESLARDLLLFKELGLHMVGVGPWLPHPQTPLGQGAVPVCQDQVPNDELMTYKVVALTRLLIPDANIPSTTALTAKKGEEGRELGLQRGANVIMPNLTPQHYRRLYEIYPAKARTADNADAFDARIKARIWAIGRVPGEGRGDSRAHRREWKERQDG
jgi:biotin synthase